MIQPLWLGHLLAQHPGHEETPGPCRLSRPVLTLHFPAAGPTPSTTLMDEEGSLADELLLQVEQDPSAGQVLQPDILARLLRGLGVEATKNAGQATCSASWSPCAP